MPQIGNETRASVSQFRDEDRQRLGLRRGDRITMRPTPDGARRELFINGRQRQDVLTVEDDPRYMYYRVAYTDEAQVSHVPTITNVGTSEVPNLRFDIPNGLRNSTIRPARTTFQAWLDDGASEMDSTSPQIEDIDASLISAGTLASPSPGELRTAGVTGGGTVTLGDLEAAAAQIRPAPRGSNGPRRPADWPNFASYRFNAPAREFVPFNEDQARYEQRINTVGGATARIERDINELRASGQWEVTTIAVGPRIYAELRASSVFRYEPVHRPIPATLNDDDLLAELAEPVTATRDTLFGIRLVQDDATEEYAIAVKRR
jgi:hypothetical protein